MVQAPYFPAAEPYLRSVAANAMMKLCRRDTICMQPGRGSPQEPFCVNKIYE